MVANFIWKVIKNIKKMDVQLNEKDAKEYSMIILSYFKINYVYVYAYT